MIVVIRSLYDVYVPLGWGLRAYMIRREGRKGARGRGVVVQRLGTDMWSVLICGVSQQRRRVGELCCFASV